MKFSSPLFSVSIINAVRHDFLHLPFMLLGMDRVGSKLYAVNSSFDCNRVFHIVSKGILLPIHPVNADCKMPVLQNILVVKAFLQISIFL